MRKILIILFVIPFITFGQVKFSDWSKYEFFHVSYLPNTWTTSALNMSSQMQRDTWGHVEKTKNFLIEKVGRNKVLPANYEDWPDKVKQNRHKVLFIEIWSDGVYSMTQYGPSGPSYAYWRYRDLTHLTKANQNPKYTGNLETETFKHTMGMNVNRDHVKLQQKWERSHSYDNFTYDNSSETSILKELDDLGYNKEQLNTEVNPDSILYGEKTILEWEKYFDNAKNLDQIEGIWNYNATAIYENNCKNCEGYGNTTKRNYSGDKCVVVKTARSYEFQVFQKNQTSTFTFESSAVNNIYTGVLKYESGLSTNFNVILKEGALLTYSYEKPLQQLKNERSSWNNSWNNDRVYFEGNWIKLYPKLNSKNSLVRKNNEWAGNGSGIIISKSGHIITNYHVIEEVNDVEVEFILNDDVHKFNAEILQVDKVNDLAILKIHDLNFDMISSPPYNFKTRSSDVGTKVYAYGYPMALTAMGKEIKVTDGIISSKTGFDGNITTYQITAPIQSGNSGGPLFDEKGNLIGINSSGLKKDIADNVGYSIKTSYVLNLIDILPKSIDLPSSNKLESLSLTEQIKEISKYVVLVKVK